jgi:hypothetical protein
MMSVDHCLNAHIALWYIYKSFLINYISLAQFTIQKS